MFKILVEIVLNPFVFESSQAVSSLHIVGNYSYRNIVVQFLVTIQLRVIRKKMKLNKFTVKLSLMMPYKR